MKFPKSFRPDKDLKDKIKDLSDKDESSYQRLETIAGNDYDDIESLIFDVDNAMKYIYDKIDPDKLDPEELDAIRDLYMLSYVYTMRFMNLLDKKKYSKEERLKKIEEISIKSLYTIEELVKRDKEAKDEK